MRDVTRDREDARVLGTDRVALHGGCDAEPEGAERGRKPWPASLRGTGDQPESDAGQNCGGGLPEKSEAPGRGREQRFDAREPRIAGRAERKDLIRQTHARCGHQCHDGKNSHPRHVASY